MDRAYYNIEKLGMIEEVQENRIFMAKSPPNEHQIYREEKTIPPPDRIKSIARMFGGTIGENKGVKESLENSKTKSKLNLKLKMKKKIDPQGGRDNQKESVAPNLIQT